MNEYDKIQAHRQAQDGARNMYEQHYEQGQNADQVCIPATVFRHDLANFIQV